MCGTSLEMDLSILVKWRGELGPDGVQRSAVRSSSPSPGTRMEGGIPDMEGAGYEYAATGVPYPGKEILPS